MSAGGHACAYYNSRVAQAKRTDSQVLIVVPTSTHANFGEASNCINLEGIHTYMGFGGDDEFAPGGLDDYIVMIGDATSVTYEYIPAGTHSNIFDAMNKTEAMAWIKQKQRLSATPNGAPTAAPTAAQTAGPNATPNRAQTAVPSPIENSSNVLLE
jgi:hypothetical protein